MLALDQVQLDTTLRSERVLVERAVLSALDGLRAVVGGYLEALDPYQGELVGDDMEDIKQRLMGRCPGILVAIGDSDYDLKSLSRRSAVNKVEVEIAVVSASLRSLEARSAGDEAGILSQGDPGIYVMLADVRDRLMGADLGVPGVERPIPVSEERLLIDEDLVVYRALYSVRCSVVPHPPRFTAAGPVTVVHHKHNVDGADAVNPVAEGETTSA